MRSLCRTKMNNVNEKEELKGLHGPVLANVDWLQGLKRESKNTCESLRTNNGSGVLVETLMLIRMNYLIIL